MKLKLKNIYFICEIYSSYQTPTVMYKNTLVINAFLSKHRKINTNSCCLRAYSNVYLLYSTAVNTLYYIRNFKINFL